VDSDAHRTWLAPSPDVPVELASFVSRGTRLGSWEAAGGTQYEVVRPISLVLNRPPAEVKDSSQALPLWRSGFVLPDALPELPVPQRSRWADLVVRSRFALHVAGGPMEVRRFTPGAEGEVKSRDGSTRRARTTYAVEGRAAALGFALAVDGFVLDTRPLDVTDERVRRHLLTPAWRTLAFRALLEEDPDLGGITNPFQRGWLSLLYLTAYGVAAVTEPPGTDVGQLLADGRWTQDIGTMLAVLYRSADPDDADEGAPNRLVETLRDLVLDGVVREAVERHARVLGDDDPVTTTAHVARRAYAETLAAAIRDAALRVVPDAQENDLVVDVEETGEGFRVLLTETANGGLGLVEQLRAIHVQDPRRFWGLVTRALGPSDYEEVDRSVRRVLEDAVADPAGATASALQEFREAAGVREADRALRDLFAAWAAVDGPPRHLAVAALSSRFLRPGASSQTTADALRLLAAWDELERRCGAEVDARVVSYALRYVDPSISLGADQVFSLLWPRGNDARNRHLQHWQPYAAPLVLDRLLVQAVVERPLAVIDVRLPDWPEQYRVALETADAVELQAPSDARLVLGNAVRRVGVLPVDRGPLRVYGRLGQVAHRDGLLTAQVFLQEADQ
jgi:ATP-dependent Lhr-like helicase